VAFGGDESLAPTKERKDLAVFVRSVDHRDEAERVLRKRDGHEEYKT